MVFKNYCKSQLFFVKIIDLPQATLISKQIKNQNYRKDFAEGEVNLKSLFQCCLWDYASQIKLTNQFNKQTFCFRAKSDYKNYKKHKFH